LVAIETDPDATSSMVQFIMKDSEAYTPDVTLNNTTRACKNLATTMLNNRLRELINSNNPPFTLDLFITAEPMQEAKKLFRDLPW
jgi:zinc protease